MLTTAALCWGAHAVAGQIAVGQVQPLMLVFLRWVLVASVLWPIFGKQVREHWPTIRPKIGTVILIAVIGFTTFNTLFYFASHRTTAVNVGILQGTIPVFVLSGSLLLFGTRITAVQIVGAALAAIGLILVVTSGQPAVAFQIGLNFGDLLMLIACLCYAVYAVLLKDRPAIPGLAFFTLLTPIAALSAVPALIYETVTQGLVIPTATGFAVIAFVAVFPSCLAQICILRGVDLIGPGRAGIYINLVPIFAAMLAVLILGENFAWYHAVGLILVVGGIWLVDRKK